ncbi:hypothetical protein XA68_15889 [Ophiocordyceps unilateralis]|uniref:Enterotoxin n=1 Tax=Ophiocordyceps unilateralis TaxID=268505 RepID=A0A2A9PP23_OPHUN|nr:hypothetical protein XA68_15889 [Ophiocordyceps unilateralis]
MFSFKRAFVLGLVAISSPPQTEAFEPPVQVPGITGLPPRIALYDGEPPAAIVVQPGDAARSGVTSWTRAEIRQHIRNPTEFGGRQSHAYGNRERFFKDAKGGLIHDLQEVDLSRDGTPGKFRVIYRGIATNPEVVGIIYHPSIKNGKFRLAFHVGDRLKAGEHLNDWKLPSTMKLGDGTVVKRSEIANLVHDAKISPIKMDEFPAGTALDDELWTWYSKHHTQWRKYQLRDNENGKTICDIPGEKFNRMSLPDKVRFKLEKNSPTILEISNEELAKQINNQAKGSPFEGTDLTKFEVKFQSIHAHARKLLVIVDKDRNLDSIADPHQNNKKLYRHNRPRKAKTLTNCCGTSRKRSCVPCAVDDDDDDEEETTKEEVWEKEESSSSSSSVKAEEGSFLAKGDPSTSPKQLETAALANSISEKEFVALATTRRGLTPLPERGWSLDAVRTRLLGYKPFSPESEKLQPRGLSVNKELVRGGAVLWGVDVVLAFATDLSAWDRLAAVTSILPVAGCGFQYTAAAARQGWTKVDKADSIDAVLCVLGDAFVLGSVTAPVGLLVHVARFIIRAFFRAYSQPEPPTKEEAIKQRDESWDKEFINPLYRYLYSHWTAYPDGGFRSLLQAVLTVETLAVKSEAAQTIAALNASSQQAVESAGSDQQRGQIQDGVRRSIDVVRASMSAEIVLRERQALLNLQSTILVNATVSLEQASKTFNDQVITHFTSKDMIKTFTKDRRGGYLIPGGDNRVEVEAHLASVGGALRNTPLPMPGLLDIAFIVGQTHGLDLDPLTLSLRDYLKEHVKAKSLERVDIDKLVIEHARAVLLVLQRQLKEAEPEKFPVRDAQSFGDLRRLIATRYGQLYEKGDATNDEKVGRSFGQPSKAPINDKLDMPKAIGLIAELDRSAVEATLRELDKK